MPSTSLETTTTRNGSEEMTIRQRAVALYFIDKLIQFDVCYTAAIYWCWRVVSLVVDKKILGQAGVQKHQTQSTSCR